MADGTGHTGRPCDACYQREVRRAVEIGQVTELAYRPMPSLPRSDVAGGQPTAE